MDNGEAPKILRARKPPAKKKAAVGVEVPGEPAPAAADAEGVVADSVPEVDKPEEAVVAEPPEPVPPVRMSRGPRGPYKPRVKKEAVVDATIPAINAPMPPPDLNFWAALQHSLRAHQLQAKTSKYAAMQIV